MNDLANNALNQHNANPNIITDRAYQDTRLSYPAYPSAPDYSIQPNDAASSNYYGDETVNFSLIALQHRCTCMLSKKVR